MPHPLRRVVATALAIALLTGLFVSAPASAQTPVTDVAALVQHILAYFQRYEQIRLKYEQLKSLQKQLESFGESGEWDSLHGLLGELDQMFRVGENLGYLLVGVDEIFDETFPGYEPPVFWPDEVALRIRRTRDTLHLITKALNRLTWPNTHSQIALLKVQASSRAADSPLEELETLGMWNNLQLLEQHKQLQATLLTANAITASAAAELQVRAAAEAARSSWLIAEASPTPGHDPSDGFAGVPDNWP
ncbi:MAG TPA: hypothetical protein VE078_08700, partial [Thermoanaerobaculia bacterium]|nr:hypothetical protein [Thermoanaerobaculia bacterium]